LLRDIATQQRRTIVIVSHDHRIREVADRVLWLQDGRFEGFDDGDSWQAALRDTAGVRYGASPRAPAPAVVHSERVKERGGFRLPWLRD